MSFRRIRVQLMLIQALSLVLLVGVGAYASGKIMELSQEKNNLYAESSLEQVGAGIDSQLESVAGIAQSFAYSEDVQGLLLSYGSTERASHYRAAMNNAFFITKLNPDILDIAIVPETGFFYSFGNRIQYNFVYTLIAAREKEDKAGRVHGFLGKNISVYEDWYAYTLPIYSSKPYGILGKKLGTCVVLCSASSVRQIIDLAVPEGVGLRLARTSGDSIIERGQPEQPGRVRVLNRNTLALRNAPWVLEQTVYQAGALTASPSSTFLLLSICASCAVLLVFMIFIQKNITNPILQINKELAEVARNPGKPFQVRVQCNNELSAIAGRINEMLVEILEAKRKEAESERYRLEVELTMNKLQLTMLQSQINPHFLYNTLACIRGVALRHAVPVIAETASNMAQLFRYSIKNDAFVRVRDEISIVSKYLSIMNLRMDNRYSVIMDAEPALEDCWMAKMVLQPLVENAIFHGLERIDHPGVLRLRVCAVGESELLIEIEDNGAGMDARTVDRLNLSFAVDKDAASENEVSQMGIGMLNVHRKIQILNGKAFGLQVQSVLGEYTRVRVRLPLLRAPTDMRTE